MKRTSIMMRKSSLSAGPRNSRERIRSSCRVQVEDLPAQGDAQQVVETAVHNYFAYRANLNRLELRQLLKRGRTSLIIGLVFLGLCLITSELLLQQQMGTLPILVRESLTIAGWVAMWRPMQIFLYDWWPLLRKGRLFQKLSRMPVEVRKRTG